MDDKGFLTQKARRDLHDVSMGLAVAISLELDHRNLSVPRVLNSALRESLVQSFRDDDDEDDDHSDDDE